jgi:hypothetical protein
MLKRWLKSQKWEEKELKNLQILKEKSNTPYQYQSVTVEEF